MAQRTLPWSLPRRICLHHDAWVVGSAATEQAWTTDFAGIRDLDILVPFASWPGAANTISDACKHGVAEHRGLTVFGGYKLFLPETADSRALEVDVWPGNLGDFLSMPRARAVWHPTQDIRWGRLR